MVRLLLVDDEIHAVEGIRSAVNWGKLGISEVHSAYDIHQAKEIFRDYPVDIMLCDIEMPQGSGLELLDWVREQYPNTESIFLTCHADFQFAKQAIQLGSFDYLLKPVPIPELEVVIAKALEKRSKESKKNEYSRYGQYWLQHQPLLIEKFWLDILNRSISTQPEAIRKAAEDRNIPYTDKMRFVPVFIAVKRWLKELSMREEKILEYALRKSAEELLLHLGSYGQLILLGKGEQLLILSFEQWTEDEEDKLRNNCNLYIESCHKYFYCDLSCYVGNPAYPHELPEMTDQLQSLDRNNVACNNSVILLNGKSFTAIAHHEPELNIWFEMLKEGDKERIIKETTRYLTAWSNDNGLNARTLHQFQQDFLQMVYSYLQTKGIQAHRLFGDDQSIELSMRAARSVIDMIDWIDHIVGTSIQHDKMTKQSESVVERVAAFITKNLDQTLSREDIAKHVFLNPDYLDRLFKRETGISVTEFLFRERMTVAQNLLLRTDMPVSAIAARVGYLNFSHFSRVFKKYSSKNPIEFRAEPMRTKE
ncbi:response regulator transcription factor [Gorillibacterium massiliense]|uniref:response regulator transcription factor n=1 Tax=Gorillibacterium massiliense TaxID=1280390 RepID=UPI0004B702E9|nr:response regulator [Gorillibacterium massiliense]